MTLLGGYFLTLNRILHNDHKQWIKEPITAVFYFLAVVGMAFLELPSVWLSSWILALIFFLLVSQNLLLFSWFERFKNAEVINTVSYLGTSSARKIIRGIALVNIILAVFFFGGGVSYVHLAAFTLTLASVFLSFLTSKPDYFLQNERYRWLGDAVFLLPVWLLFV